ncbi:hypothetical protein GYMLUDRAFT_927097 [Collybiopsis luxurians FD-317 M1]|uniref:Uncharacterized protein n=1 Tax=Collybiopsis luxurians FD-317 M1 TaxID=944289 RepID=A0A0D0C6U3_9AGAR|nr:hypothetical protein GYMLUDRAFT_927097 [Collybiopsis luxurians FD-317 M1]
MHLTQSGGSGSPISSRSVSKLMRLLAYFNISFNSLVVLKQIIQRRWNMFDPCCRRIQHFYPQFNADPSTLLSSTIRALVVSAQYSPRLQYILILIEFPLILQSSFHSAAYSAIGRKS